MNNQLDTVIKNITEVKERVAKAALLVGRDPKTIKIVAATKTVPAEIINFACENGISCIGENRVQELLEKYDKLNKEKIEIHFIGTLQTNKVKYIIDKVEMIHSVDSVKLAEEISKQAKKHGIVMKILIEVNIGAEESKSGVSPEDVIPLLEKIASFEGVSVQGLMAIPPAGKSIVEEERNETNIGNNSSKMHYNENKNKTFDYFQKIQQIVIDISAKKIDNITIKDLSLGMSGDFEEAIKAGSTMIRPGRILFGDRVTSTK